MSNKKHLSYFNNKYNLEKIRSEKIKKISGSFWGSIIISFLIIIAIAFCLRFIEDLVFQPKETLDKINPLYISYALAGEVENKTELISQSHSTVKLKPDAAFTFTLKFKNTGTSIWTKDKVFLKSSTTALKFRHQFWPDAYLPAQLLEKQVQPGETGTFKFALQAPSKENNYNGDFLLVNNNVLIKGGNISVNLITTDDPSSVSSNDQENNKSTNQDSQTTEKVTTESKFEKNVCTLNFQNGETLTIKTTKTEKELLADGTDYEGLDNISCALDGNFANNGPEIRVGLFHTEEAITIKNKTNWQILDSNDLLLASIPAEMEMKFIFIESKKQYVFDFIDKTIRTTNYLKLNNLNTDSLWTITSLEDRPSWNKSINYNDFEGDLEIRYNSSHDRVWLINELPMEDYIKGIKETSNSNPIEYLKTMSSAARTYAMYHYTRNNKHDDEYFHVDAKYDQVYKGHTVKEIMPNLTEAVDQCKGVVGTYEDKIIIAPYFSWSDGRTRSYQEVWHWDIPYLISKKTPYTADRELYGHGVGIDATDALNRAKKDDWNYSQILKYYYTGIDLEKIY